MMCPCLPSLVTECRHYCFSQIHSISSVPDPQSRQDYCHNFLKGFPRAQSLFCLIQGFLTPVGLFGVNSLCCRGCTALYTEAHLAASPPDESDTSLPTCLKPFDSSCGLQKNPNLSSTAYCSPALPQGSLSTFYIYPFALRSKNTRMPEFSEQVSALTVTSYTGSVC